jgi:sporulation protein YlmC with PRC-barrel domain|nr:CBS domain-containing protein [Candidatus Acidoferrales bacterium]
MLHATELLGAATYDVLGNYVGRVRELFIEPADQPNRVARFLLARGKFQPLVARYDQVAFAVPGSMKLNVGEKSLEEYHANEGWLAVQKDLLDQQIIDTGGRKVVRVNDLELAEHHINDCVELRVSQADVGVTGAVGRLLQGIVSPALIRRIQDRLPARMIRWEFVNLIEPDPLRRIKLRVSHQKLAHLHPADLADILEALSSEERQSIIDSLDETSAAETLAELDSRLRQQIVEKLDPEKAADIIEEMDPDQAADLLAGLSPETSKELLEEMPHHEASDVRALMKFEQNTAGGMMNTQFMLVGETATREEVIDFIRSNESDLEQLDAVFLTDLDAKFTGLVPTGKLLLATNGQTMNSLKSEPLLFLPPDANEKEVFELFDKYNLRVLGVVDESGVPIGAITVDDVVTRLAAKV